MSALILHQNKTWAENAIEHWLAMPPSDESAALLDEIMREHARDLIAPRPRRMRRGMVRLRRVAANQRRKSRITAANFRQYYREGVSWPFGAQNEEISP